MPNLPTEPVKNSRRLTGGLWPLPGLGGAPFDAGEREEGRAIPHARCFALFALGIYQKEVARDVGFDRISDMSDIYPSRLRKHLA